MDLWKRFREISLTSFEKLYKDLGITFDSSDGEAFYNDKMEPALALLRERNLLSESEGAVVFDMGKDPMGEPLKPALLKKSDGSTLYLTRDLAAALYRLQTYKPDRLIYVVGAPQRDHFHELFTILSKLDPANEQRFTHVDFGQYRLTDGKMGSAYRQGGLPRGHH